MRFTEHELTLALTGAAKTVLAAQRRDVRRGKVDVERAWADLDRMQRFQILDGLGGEILPVLVALPDVPVATGERATYSEQQVRETVESLIGDSAGGRLRRTAVSKARTALVVQALAHLPPRTDPDTLTVPDHL